MDIDFLHKNYPNSFFTVQQNDSKKFFFMPSQNEYLAIPLQDISETELNILNHIKEKIHHHTLRKPENPWHDFLFFDGKQPKEKKAIRTIQFLITSQEENEATHWLSAMKEMFNTPLAAFFVDGSYGVIIEKEQKSNYSLEEIEGILKTLENDFSIKAKAFVSSYLPLDEQYKALFLAQKQLFLSEQNQIQNNQAVGIASIALDYLTKDTFKQSILFNFYAEQLSLDTEMKEIILALWHNQGNISSAAKELYMHRNTLRYRIEKFSEQTSLSLKSMDDLVLAYLFVQHSK